MCLHETGESRITSGLIYSLYLSLAALTQCYLIWYKTKTIIFIFLCTSSMDTDAITSDLAIVKHTVVKKNSEILRMLAVCYDET